MQSADTVEGEEVITKPQKYFTRAEVAIHSVQDDAWVTIFGKVYDITEITINNKDPLTWPLLKYAGQDISHWFDAKTHQVKTHVDPVSWLVMPFTPYGRFIHVPPNRPSSSWNTNFVLPWWQNTRYIIGDLTVKSRKLRLNNALTHQDDTIEVCSEETLLEIQKRYVEYNAHASSYTWKFLGRNLDMKKSLHDNGIEDESEELNRLGINEDDHLPSIQLYFNDDFTVA